MTLNNKYKYKKKNKTFFKLSKKYKGGINLNNYTVRCSPKKKEELNTFSCYTNGDLIKLKNIWNARHSNPEQKITTNEPKQIHAALSQQMKTVCNQESCWLKQQFIDSGLAKTIKAGAFAPNAPIEWNKNPNEWLSSIDITNVMHQYEKAYKCFDFIGPTPIDFDTKIMYNTCVWKELCNFSIADQIKRKKTKIGIIFNTDTHDKSGQHWISMFINIRSGLIFFFDSVGEKAPPEIMRLVERIIQQGKELPIPINFKFDQNYPVEHQYGNTECGIYSLFFIIHMLEDKITAHYLKNHILKDKYMQTFRNIYFNKNI